MKAPVVEKDAGVEALFWRVHVLDELLGHRDLQRVMYHYVRLKVFDDKGKEKVSTIELHMPDKTFVAYVHGRVVKSDGTILELNKDSIYDKDILRAGRRRLKAKAFAMPGVEPGAIVEYRWKEVRTDPHVMYERLQLQREYPVQKVTYFVHPLGREYTNFQMFTMGFNCNPSPLKAEDDGFESTSLENVPGFQEEPMMPGEPNVRPWILLEYRDSGKFGEPEKYWNKTGKEMYNDFLRQALKPNDEIRRAAANAVEGAAGNDQRVKALIRYIRSNVREFYSSRVTETERAKILKEMPENRLRTSAEVLKSGIGTPNELNILFAALASCIGMETRPALVADREDLIFSPDLADRYFLSNMDMAVNLDGKWKLHDVSARLLPSNMVSWREEGMRALLSDPKNPTFIASPLSPPEASTVVRSAKFVLSEDGGVEGDLDISYSGHKASDRRLELEGQAEAARLEHLKEQYTKSFPNAEVSDLRIDNAEDPEQALKYHCRIKIAGYAQRTGKRILIQPLFFQRGAAPLFTAAERKYGVEFPYAWSEQDTVSILIPNGYQLDNAQNPGPYEFGPPGTYQLKMVVKGGRELVTTRELIFGRGGAIAYPAKTYPVIKTVFDEIHRRDEVTLSLKQEAGK